MLGQDLMRTLPGDVRGVDIEDIDITSLESVKKTLLTCKPAVVVNAAAYTDVDGCEANRELALRVNGEGVGNLAVITRDIGAKLVHLSTDYVFDGAKNSPWVEEDRVAPLNVYGESKLLGEEKARTNPDHLIVRTQWLYGLAGKNFVETMLRLAQDKKELSVVDDQTGSPTWTVDLSIAIKALVEHDCRGTYHAANSGFCTWNGFAKAIFEDAGLDVAVKPMTTQELGRPALRPLYSVLDCGKLEKDTGFKPQGWRDALKSYLKLRIA